VCVPLSIAPQPDVDNVIQGGTAPAGGAQRRATNHRSGPHPHPEYDEEEAEHEPQRGTRDGNGQRGDREAGRSRKQQQ
jgi:hypothetical protein